MKSLELKPIHSNIVSTYLEDSIDRDRDINAFVDILNAQESSCAIALDGTWGSGKTFFVKQVKMILDTCSLSEKKETITPKKYKENGKSYMGAICPICNLTCVSIMMLGKMIMMLIPCFRWYGLYCRMSMKFLHSKMIAKYLKRQRLLRK